MTYRLQRWMTRDFVFTAPPAFPHGVAVQPERFVLQPHPDKQLPSLFVLALDQVQPWSLDGNFSSIAADLIGVDDSGGWPLVAVQLFGREGRYGTGSLTAAAGSEEAAGLVLVRGRRDRIWAFGWRAAANNRQAVEGEFGMMMQGLQARVDDVGEKTLLSQFHGQEKKRRATIEGINAGNAGSDAELDPHHKEWDYRFAAALGDRDSSAAEQFFAPAIALLEEPFSEEVPLGASRIGGGPDLPPGAWPSNEHGMRHPFLLQIDLAEVTAVFGSTGLIPDDGLLSLFVHDDALLVDVVYTPPGTSLVRYPMTEAIIEASSAAIKTSKELGANTSAGPLPHTEGDLVTAELMVDGTLQFAHTPDPVWAEGEPGARFEALSDERWATATYARLRPLPTRTFDVSAAEVQIDQTGIGSFDDLVEIYEAFEHAQAGPHAGAGTPQVHQMLGHATIRGGQDCRKEAAEMAESAGWSDLGNPDAWIVLFRLRAGSATGLLFWDAADLVIMASAIDMAARRFERLLLLSG
ncbi:DUF1963 domain-containing protein [Phyllobacterium sp. K27]